MEFRKMVMITLYVRQQKRHRCIEQSFGEGGCHYLHYLHHSLVSGQKIRREQGLAHQQKIGLKNY